MDAHSNGNWSTFQELDQAFKVDDPEQAQHAALIETLRQHPTLLPRLVTTISDCQQLVARINKAPYYQLQTDIIKLWLGNHAQVRSNIKTLDDVKLVQRSLRPYYGPILKILLADTATLHRLAPDLEQFNKLSQLHGPSLGACEASLLRDQNFCSYIQTPKDFAAALSRDCMPHLQHALSKKLMQDPQRVVHTKADKALLLRFIHPSFQAALQRVPAIDATPVCGKERLQQQGAKRKLPQQSASRALERLGKSKHQKAMPKPQQPIPSKHQDTHQPVFHDTAPGFRHTIQVDENISNRPSPQPTSP